MKDVENLNCVVMKDMDYSKMDMNDFVMQVMMKQCMKDMYYDDDFYVMSYDDIFDEDYKEGLGE